MSRTWLVTGTSSGFGRILTEEVLKNGDTVYATVRNLEALQELQAKYGEHLHLLRLDVTDMAEVRAKVDQAFADAGRIDVVFSNAGYGLAGAAEEVSDEQIRKQIETNLVGSIQVIRTALPHMRAQGGGRIIQNSSEGGLIAYPNFSLYHATKWGIEGFVEAVAQEVKPFQIELTLVEPSATNTNFASSSLNTGKPMDVYANTPAGEVRRVLAGEGSKWEFDDPHWMVQAIIASVDECPAPPRMPMGIGAFERMRDSLQGRLAQIEGEANRSRGVGYRAQ